MLRSEKNKMLWNKIQNTYVFLVISIQNISKTICELRGCCFMPGYSCYHSLPARQRYTFDGDQWNTDAELRPFYTLTPLETDAITKLRLDVRSISSDIAVVTLFDPEKHNYAREGSEVFIICVCFSVYLSSLVFLLFFLLHLFLSSYFFFHFVSCPLLPRGC